jgi:CheY-like chemotaxis protein
MVLRVLLIEDTPERQEVLKQLFRDHAWILVHTANRAQTLLSAFEWDVIALDYDLAGEETGEEVAKYMATHRITAPRVIVHSQNAVGRKRIRAWLPDAWEIPLSRMIKTNKIFRQLRAELARGSQFDWSFLAL